MSVPNAPDAGTAAWVSPKQLTQRWQVSRSSVDRIAVREKFRKLVLGDGRNSPVRYHIDDVESFERRRVA